MGEPNILRKAVKDLPRVRVPATSALAGLLVTFGVAAYWPAIVALWRYWMDQSSLGGHGLLVAPLAMWLAWRARDRIDSKPVRAAPWALLLLVPCSIAALIFWKSGIQALQLLMLPAVIWLAVLAAFGIPVARALAVPIGYICFAMPVWNLLSVPLQELTARAVGLLGPVVGLPAAVSGTSIAFSNGARFIVTLACSGVGFLTQGLAVAVLLGELEEANFARRLGLLVSMAVIAVVTNWVRVLLLLAIGYLDGMDNAIVSKYHLELGYLLFVIVLVTFVWVVTRRTVPAADAHVRRAVGPLPAGFPGAIVGLIAAPVLVAFWLRPPSVESDAVEVTMLAASDAWRGPLPASDATWRPVFVGAHAEQRAAYKDHNDHTVEALSISYPVQLQGRELVNEGNSLLGADSLAPVDASFIDAEGGTYREDVAVDETGNRSVIWSFYDIEGQSFVVPVLSQLSYGMQALTSRPTSDLFAFRTACTPTCDEARAVLQAFLHDFGSEAGGFNARSARKLDRKSGPSKLMNGADGSQDQAARPVPLTSMGNSLGAHV